MYMNHNTYNKYQENHECKNCENQGICKWTGDMKFKKQEVDKIPITKGITPIKIKITCDEYDKKAQRQDGLTYRG